MSPVDQPVKDVTIKVTVSKKSANLLADLHRHGPYYRSRRLIHLAELGLAVERNGAVMRGSEPLKQDSPVSDVAASTQQEVGKTGNSHRDSQAEHSKKQSNKDEQHLKQAHYIIPEGAADALGAMFDELER